MFHKKRLLLFLFVFVASCNGHNIVMFLTDDQDVVLGGMNPMKSVQRFIADAGVTFTNSYTASPICCPSRASILTGLYPHNHLTHGNSIQTGCYSEHWRTHENNTFANILHDAGYSTFYAGKYLNQYGSKKSGGSERVPPGWTEWHGLVGNSVYYNYTLSNNGVPTVSDDLYLTDVIRNLAISYIENQTGSQPFLMVLAPPAPHQPFTPAPRHKGVFSNVTALRNPSFNVEGTDKHWLIRMPPSPLPQSMMAELDRVYRDRWEALLAVDEMVADVVNALDSSNMLPDTYLIFTSDNGYHIGQFSQVYDKRQPYETDIKIPLVISGPGIKPNTTNETPVINIDLAPTIISLAGLKPPSFMDGKALDLQNGSVETRNLLIEYYGEGNTGTVDAECPWKYDGGNLAECYPQYDCKCQDSINNTYACLRHFDTNIDMKYCLFSDKQQFIEIYNLAEDRHELINIIDEVFPAVREHYNTLLHRLLVCAGANCDVGKEL